MHLILAQTDTTVGFLSQDESLLARTKGRPENKPFLKVFSTFKQMTQHTRIPLKYRTWVRHARKTTFVIKNQALRYVGGSPHARLVEHYGWLYSTSANESGQHFNRDFCEGHSDLIIEDSHGLHERASSKIFKLTSTQYTRLR
jgi:tRNA A37 threonylcarbamoyladenosine synthetase subunit TsaC/SUA5/YrdC